MNNNRFNRGVAILSACLKKAGFETSLIHISNHISKDIFLNTIKDIEPDVIAYSYMSLQFKNILQYIKWSNELNILTIHGGLHPTVNPKECFDTGEISILCRGEGDQTIVEFCEVVQAGKDYTKIDNFSYKLNSDIINNPIRSVIEDLDYLPFMDYEIFKYETCRESTLLRELVVQASRGCYYNCTYCCNHLQKNIIPNKKKYLRFHSVDRIILEIETALNRYPFLDKVTFDDDTLTQDVSWFEEFADKYAKKIGLPYSCNDRVNNINDHTAHLLLESGCIRVTMGIENGNDYIRRKVMKRPISDERILNAFSILKKYKIETGAFNIMGMIGETVSSILDTIRLNAKANPEKTFNAYFYPFYGTEAYKQVIDNNIPILEHNINDFFTKPTISLNTVSYNQLIFFYKYFILLRGIYKYFFRFSPKFSLQLINTYENLLKSKYFPFGTFALLFPGKDQIVNKLQKYKYIYNALRMIKKKIIG